MPTASVRTWWQAARPHTLPASIAPVLVGTAASLRVGTAITDIHLVRFALALAVAMLLQVAVNYANDWSDGVRGVDTPDRVGPTRAVASGAVTANQMKLATFATLGLAGVAGLALTTMVGWELLLVGVAAIAAALTYSGGPKPYANEGLGEVFVFVFFGVVATAGSAYVQDEALHALPVLVSVPIGMLASALLVVNNLRDIPTDEQVGKDTLAVRIGDASTRTLFVTLAMGAVVFAVLLFLVTAHIWYWLALASVPLLTRATRRVRNGGTGSSLVIALGQTARGQLVYAVMFTLALVLRSPGS